jgi:precorrin-8X/cobalt-precorrin-8 methylmutase
LTGGIGTCILSNKIDYYQVWLFMMLPTGVIILCHGSRGERGALEVAETLKRLTEGVKPFLSPGVEVIGAALQFNHPTLEEAAESLVGRGVERVVIMPYFLFSGRHITEDIPHLAEELSSRYRDKKFIVTKPLGSEEHFIVSVARRIGEAVPELNSRPSLNSPQEIERQSMEIVERFLPPLKISADERMIMKHIVHAGGDPQLASLVRFSPSAVSRGLSAIVKGSPVFTDVRMVAAGINRHLAGACGCPISCALDETEGSNPGTTRAAAAMVNLGKRLNGAVVAIGNAPTALLALLDLVDNDGVKPALIVGMPVGFVQAKEAKDELMKRAIPYITIAGTRGGSSLAVATVNALLKIAGGVPKC